MSRRNYVEDRICEINQANAAFLIFLYVKFKKQLIAYSSHIKFVQQCLRLKLTLYVLLISVFIRIIRLITKYTVL